METPGKRSPTLSRQSVAAGVSIASSRRRLSPEELHAMRVAWGKKWGKLVSDAVRELLKEGE
jgi:hypothetical protein